MKKNIFFVIALFCAVKVFAQNDSLIEWDVHIKKTGDSTYELAAETVVPKDWHLYGNNSAIDGLETVKFNYSYENVGSQNGAQFNRTAEIIKDHLFDNKSVNVYTGKIGVSQKIVIRGIVPSKLKGTIDYFLGKSDSFIPEEQDFEVPLEGGTALAPNEQRIIIPTVDILHPLAGCGHQLQSNSLWMVFLLGFLGGVIAFLTPCVFPMVPVTVSFFIKRSGSRKQAVRNGAAYGLFILLIYTLLSLPFHLLGKVQPGIFNAIATNVVLNVSFFMVFILFAISFFGFFDITLPTGIAGKADSRSNVGSLSGIFFMALTLVIVSFSCTGVILGSLLVGYLKDGAWPLTTGLSGFGLALALPFALFAVFPGWLKSLPKSGGWLDTVKKTLAFVELALAFKFLSNADLVMHWGLLKREVFIGIWIIIGAGLTLYLFGLLHLPHDVKGMKISTGRKTVGVLTILFTLYLIPGVSQTQYANIKLLSGFPPPLSYSIYGKNNVNGKGLAANIINDYNQALQLSKQQHKPLLIDFTGWACVNCRKMEENVWTQPEVYHYIKENFILVSLYVDDREKLPILQRFIYTEKDGTKQDILTMGDKWTAFESENFAQVTQPLYVILNNEEQLLNNPVGYTPDAKEYFSWLQCAKNTFDSHN